MITPYLTFDGNCLEAINFYTDALNVKVEGLLKMGDAPANPAFPLPEAAKNLIMQATLNLGTMYVRMSDCFPGKPFNDVLGDRISFTLRPKTEEEGKAFFDKLKVGGKVEMEPQKTFFSSFYCTLVDRFNVRWQIAAE